MTDKNTQAVEAAVERLMTLAQEFASGWSLVGGPFDNGSAMGNAEEVKEELRNALRAELTRPQEVAAVGYAPARCSNCGKPHVDGDDYITEGDPEGEFFCSSECHEQHDELGCPHEHHSGYRHPGESARLIACEGALRSLASWLSVGGYNAPQVDAKGFEEKIRWGVDHLFSAASHVQEVVGAEPVAVIGDTFSLFWVGSKPIAELARKHNLKVGDKLYTAPPSTATADEFLGDNAPDWANRSTESLEGWINELATLSDHPKIIDNWARRAMWVIVRGLRRYAAPPGGAGGDVGAGKCYCDHHEHCSVCQPSLWLQKSMTAAPAAEQGEAKDAARYRCLRQDGAGDDLVVNGELLSGERLDAATDAILASKPTGEVEL